MEKGLKKDISGQKDLLSLLEGIVKITIGEKVVYSASCNIGSKANR
ncbi:hypothetical protein [Clostridium sardiniense]|nr:hypothetical protein [Clostridium sardiniense]MBM7834989.1 hypothetical protein [Clostridium sardiniense]